MLSGQRRTRLDYRKEHDDQTEMVAGRSRKGVGLQTGAIGLLSGRPFANSSESLGWGGGLP